MQTLQELIGFCLRQTERRKQTDYVGSADSCKDFLFEEEAFSDFLDWLFKFHTDHQTSSSDFLDLFEMSEFFQQVSAYRCGILYQVLALHDIQYGNGSGASQVVASEGGSELTVNRSELRTDQYPPIGKPLAMPLAMVIMSGRMPLYW